MTEQRTVWVKVSEHDGRVAYMPRHPQPEAADPGRIAVELSKALECLMDEFNHAERSGRAGLRAQAIAHVRQAILLLTGATETV